MGISDYTRLQHSLLSPLKTGINILNETVPAYWVAWQKNKQTFNLNSNQTYGSQLSADGNKWTYPFINEVFDNNKTVNLTTTAQNVGYTALSGFAGLVGEPITAGIVQSVYSSTTNFNPNTQYNLTSFEAMANYGRGDEWTKYRDFRVQPKYGRIRLDGTGATINSALSGNWRASYRSIAYAAASATPGGAYKLFNRETIYGWGTHGETSVTDLDFSARSHISTLWDGSQWVQTMNPIELATPFRGDKINAIDYIVQSTFTNKDGETKPIGGNRLKTAYRWKPKLWGSALGGFSDFAAEYIDQTTDFIKFYLTGPKLHPGSTDSDDIIVFRATLTSLTDNFQANWSEQQMVGRADPNYLYSGFSRSITFSFPIHVTDRDEMKPIWRKLNALASYTAPEYVAGSIAMKAPWMRITIGDIFVQQPIIITSVDYTLQDSETTWEINIEDDATMMQAPKKIEVSISANLIGNEIPQKNGAMYSLAKQFENGIALAGNDNWLSDFKNGEQLNAERNAKLEQRRAEKTTITIGNQPTDNATTAVDQFNLLNELKNKPK